MAARVKREGWQPPPAGKNKDVIAQPKRHFHS